MDSSETNWLNTVKKDQIRRWHEQYKDEHQKKLTTGDEATTSYPNTLNMNQLRVDCESQKNCRVRSDIVRAVISNNCSSKGVSFIQL